MSEIMTRVHPSGAWQVSDIVAGYWVTQTYYGYTKRESLRLFREHVKVTA